MSSSSEKKGKGGRGANGALGKIAKRKGTFSDLTRKTTRFY